MRRSLLTIIILVVLLTACRPKEQLKPDPSGQAENTAAAINDLAFDLYRQLSSSQGNLFFSPTSISTALAMTWAGTDGPTAKETAAVLHLGADRDQTMANYSKFLAGCAGSDETFTLNVANRIWGQEGFPFHSTYISDVQTHFGGGLETCDFKSAHERERRKINDWVEDQTAGKIKDLMPPGSINARTKLVLTNAVYFLGQWQFPFRVDRTADEIFHSANGVDTKIPTMKLKKSLPYYEGDDWDMVSLPYKGNELDFLVILPHKNRDLHKIITSLSAQTLTTSLSALAPRMLDVWLPKMDLAQSFQLDEPLKGLGLHLLFDSGQADFSRMSDHSGLFVSSVVHKSYLKVDEQGTEAAAATGITVGVTSMPAPPIMFRADHPFIFMIRQKSTGAIFFMGRFSQP